MDSRVTPRVLAISAHDRPASRCRSTARSIWPPSIRRRSDRGSHHLRASIPPCRRCATVRLRLPTRQPPLTIRSDIRQPTLTPNNAPTCGKAHITPAPVQIWPTRQASRPRAPQHRAKHPPAQTHRTPTPTPTSPSHRRARGKAQPSPARGGPLPWWREGDHSRPEPSRAPSLRPGVTRDRLRRPLTAPWCCDGGRAPLATPRPRVTPA
jgi:hypothetical protein